VREPEAPPDALRIKNIKNLAEDFERPDVKRLGSVRLSYGAFFSLLKGPGGRLIPKKAVHFGSEFK
jgi:hypothetical protein